jgi:MarR family transcriptional regulator, organic hydroperoxide resistance regulator
MYLGRILHVTLPIQQELRQTRPFASLVQEVVAGLLRTADVVRRLVDDVIEAAGITGQHYNVLRILRGAGKSGLPTLDIAERMIEQTPGITRLIDRLEAKGLVTRERCATDRRQVFCRIAKAGLTLLAKLDDPVNEAGKEAVRTLSRAEVAQLIELLDRTRDHVNQQFASRERN